MGKILIGLIVFIAAAMWFMLLDGKTGRGDAYDLKLAEMRALVAADDPASLPTDIAVQFVGADEIPFMGAQAGGGFETYTMARTAFLIEGPRGNIIIDPAMDKDIAETFNRGSNPSFDEAAFARVAQAMETAALIVVTHAHPDHIGGIPRHPSPAKISRAIQLTADQLPKVERFSKNQHLDPAFETLAPMAVGDDPVRLAPGLVVRKADGHTPDSVIFYLRLADGREALFIGDIGWTRRNVESITTRPRVVQRFIMHPVEDRGKVLAQLKALNAAMRENPSLLIIPAHDGVHLNELIATGAMREGF